MVPSIEHRRTRGPLEVLVVLLGLGLLGARPAFSRADSRSINGQVRTTSNTPLPQDVTVRLKEAEGVVVAQQFVGPRGKV